MIFRVGMEEQFVRWTKLPFRSRLPLFTVCAMIVEWIGLQHFLTRRHYDENFIGNIAKSGGAIYGRNNVALRVSYSNFAGEPFIAKLLDRSLHWLVCWEFIENQASEGGGVALFDNSNFLCVFCEFNNNTANRGGALYIASVAERILLVQLTASSFINNHAYDYGGRNPVAHYRHTKLSL